MSRLRTRSWGIVGDGYLDSQDTFYLLSNPCRYGPYVNPPGRRRVNEYPNEPKFDEVTTDELSTTPPPFKTPHLFDCSKRWNDPFKFSGSVVTEPAPCKWTTVSVSNLAHKSYMVMGNGPPAHAADMSALATQAYSVINPNNDTVNLPLFLFELRELPRLLYQTGSLLSRRHAVKVSDIPSSYVASQFGWAPLINDLNALVNLGQSVERRARYINRLRQSKGSVTRRLSRSDWRDPVTVLWDVARWGSAYANISYRRHHTEYNWLTFQLRDASYAPQFENRFDEIRATLDLNLSASTLWNAIPWTWLIDWFTTLGDYLEATKGWFHYKVWNLCIMSTTGYKDEFVGLDTNIPGTVSGVGKSALRKRRSVYQYPPLPTVRNPFLTLRQMGILGSLLSVRMLGGETSVNRTLLSRLPSNFW